MRSFLFAPGNSSGLLAPILGLASRLALASSDCRELTCRCNPCTLSSYSFCIFFIFSLISRSSLKSFAFIAVISPCFATNSLFFIVMVLLMLAIFSLSCVISATWSVSLSFNSLRLSIFPSLIIFAKGSSDLVTSGRTGFLWLKYLSRSRLSFLSLSDFSPLKTRECRAGSDCFVLTRARL